MLNKSPLNKQRDVLGPLVPAYSSYGPGLTVSSPVTAVGSLPPPLTAVYYLNRTNPSTYLEHLDHQRND